MICAVFFLTLGVAATLLCTMISLTVPWIETETTVRRGSFNILLQLRMGLTRNFNDICVLKDHQGAVLPKQQKYYLRQIASLSQTHRMRSPLRLPVRDRAAGRQRAPCITDSELAAIEEPFLRAGAATINGLRAAAVCCLICIFFAYFTCSRSGDFSSYSRSVWVLLASCVLQFISVTGYVLALRHFTAYEGYLMGVWLMGYSVAITFFCIVWADAVMKIYRTTRRAEQLVLHTLPPQTSISANHLTIPRRQQSEAVEVTENDHLLVIGGSHRITTAVNGSSSSSQYNSINNL